MNNQVVMREQNEVSAFSGNTAQEKRISSLGVFSSNETFQMALQMAETMSRATIVPKDYQGNAGNCMIAIDTASRMNISPMMVMQNLYIVNGRPAWASQWIIAAINASKKYSCDLQFEYDNNEEDGGLSCTAWTFGKSGEKITGPRITMKMAKAEGWLQKNGSKWQTMPEVMISYRAASFFARRNCPEITLGIYAEEEAECIRQSDFQEATVNQKIKQDTFMLMQAEPAQIEATGTDAADIISHEQRKALFTLADAVYGEKSQDKLKAFVAEEGIESTKELTSAAFERIKNKIAKDVKKKHEEIPEV